MASATLTAGVGGSMLSIGSAAGVALMGQSKGNYTFFGHLKWTPVIALGYAASIYIHLIYNADKFDNIPIAITKFIVKIDDSGRSAALVAHLLWEQRVECSNHSAPTILI